MQSDATGQQSYAIDPTTGINYLALPYTNGADANDLITWEPWEMLQGDGATPVSLDSPQQILDGTRRRWRRSYCRATPKSEP